MRFRFFPFRPSTFLLFCVFSLSLIVLAVFLWTANSKIRMAVNDFQQICYGNYDRHSADPFFGSCLPPLRTFDAKFRVADPFKLAVCVIEKNIFCKGQNEFASLNGILAATNTSVDEWEFVAVVRDPLERFLSGFVDKCINDVNATSAYRPMACHNCSADLACFVDRQLWRAQQFVREKNWRRRQQRWWGFEDVHFFPQNWHCNFHSHFARFRFVKFGETFGAKRRMFAELFDVFRGRGVPEELLERAKSDLESDGGGTAHSTGKNAQMREGLKRKLEQSPELRRKLERMFHYDRALLGLERYGSTG